MTEVSQNGWSVIGANSTKWWKLIDSPVKMQLRRGSAGYVLTHFVDWFDRNIEKLQETQGDDFGWALRHIAGSDQWSNHSSGTAVDLNASLHPQGKRGTFEEHQYDVINRRLEQMYEAKIKWGANFTTTPDEMHFEICVDEKSIIALADKLEKTPRGFRLTAAN
jgi:hypothetical protein